MLSQNSSHSIQRGTYEFCRHGSATTQQQVTYTITATAGPNGSISPSGSVSVPVGNSPTFTITPNSGYAVDVVTVDGTSQGAITSYTFNYVTSNHTISATFKSQLNKYEIENASLSGGANVNTNHTGYSGTGFVDGFYNSTTALVSFNVNVATNGNYELRLRYSAGNGTSTNTGLYVNGVKIKNISCPGTGNWNTWADKLETVALNAGNNAIQYKAEISSGSCINLDYLILTRTGDATYTISSSAGANGSINPSGNIVVPIGNSPTFTITPNNGYQVDVVTVDGVSQGAINSYTFNFVSANHTISATFKVQDVNIQIEAENATRSGGANVNTNHTGYSGTGFVDGFLNSTTAQVTFNFNVVNGGSYKVKLRYSAGNGTSTNTGLYVNGVFIKNITCASTSNWNSWADETETVTLNGGNNTVSYKAIQSSSNCINLDKLTVTK